MGLEDLIHAALLVPLDEPTNRFCRWGLPLILWGLPGIGKSERVIVGGLKAGLTTRQIYAPRFMPDDPAGVCTPDGKGDVKIVCTMTAVRELNEIGSGVLFLDELSSSKEATQASFLGVVLDRDVAGTTMPGRIRILAAANPPEIAANGRELMSAFSNRLCHIQVPPPSGDEWSTWLMDGSPRVFLEADKGEELIKQQWDYEWGRARSIFARGIQRNSGILHVLPSEDSGKRGEAWPSPRTWEFAVRAYTTCRILGYDSTISDTLIEGCVGEAAAEVMAEWIREQDLPEPAEVLKNGFTPDPRRIDRAFIVYNTVTQYVVNQKDNTTKVTMGIRLWELFGEADAAGLLDTIVDCVKLAVSKGLARKAHKRIHELATPILERIGDAGLQELAS